MHKKLVTILMAILLFVVVGSVPVFSQDKGSGGMQTLSDSGTTSVGGYGAPVLMTTSFFNFQKWDMLTGGRGGVTLNSKFTFGGTAASTWRLLEVDHDSGKGTEKENLGLAYYGLFFEYTAKSDKIIHVSVPVELVMGTLNIGKRSARYYDYDTYYDARTLFYGVIPGVNLDVNVTSFFVVGLHAGYRFGFLDKDYYDRDNNNDAYDDIVEERDLWGLQTGVVFRFGKF